MIDATPDFTFSEGTPQQLQIVGGAEIQLTSNGYQTTVKLLHSMFPLRIRVSNYSETPIRNNPNFSSYLKHGLTRSCFFY
jgi:hypothetical protein